MKRSRHLVQTVLAFLGAFVLVLKRVAGMGSLRTLLCARRQMLGAALARLDARRGIVVTLTLITILAGPNGFLTNLPVVYAQIPPTATGQGKPNRFNPGQNAQSTIHLPPGGTSDPNWKPGAPESLERSVPPPMQPGSLLLTPGKAAQFLSSDGRLEVDVPATAITPGDRTQAGGSLTLLITQIAPASGATSGGSGLISFGTYLLQLVDVHNQRVPHGLRATLTLKYHYDPSEVALNLSHTFVVFNRALPRGVHVASAAVASTPDLGTPSTQNATLDTTRSTLSVTGSLATPSASISWDTNAPVATFGKPDLFNVDLNAGALSASYPLDLPAGPGGLTPPLSLAYTSAGVSEAHGVQSAAGYVGEGWNLAPGSISWAEHNGLAGVGGTLWENSWQLSDPYGTSAQLIPPNLNISTYYDDLNNPSTGLYESYQGQIWSSVPSGFTWANAKWVTGDFNGDGKADVMAMYNLGIQSNGQNAMAAYEWLSTGSGLHYLGQVWSSVPSGFTWANAQFVAGDFNGDGKTDIIAMYNLGGSSTGAYEWLGTSTGLSYQGQIWSSSGFTWSIATWVGGDFNGDGKADVMAMYNLGSTIGAYEWLGTSTGLSYQGRIYTSGPFTWANAKWVAGDFNGDGKADIAAAYNLGNGTFGLYEWLSTGTGLNSLDNIWTSGTFCWSCTTWATGDINGDGKTDIVALHDLGTQQGVGAVGIYEWLGSSSGFSFQGQVWSSVGRGGFTWANAAFLAGDFTGDGQADLMAMYNLGVQSNGQNATGAYEWVTTGTYITSPISWQTAPDTHARIISYWGPNPLPGASITPLCFRVFLPNGIMEEFGCTPDSLQYYYQLSGTNAGKPYVANWLLDLITDPSGNQIHFTYQADMATDSGGHQYPRDVVLSMAEWDSPTCHDMQQRCTGSSWAPLLRVSFQASHSPSRKTASLGGTCNTSTNLRCDDPLDLSGSGGLAAPQVENTFVLNDILVQDNTSGAWNTLIDYQLSYEQGGPGTITDPQTSKSESTAGALDLTKISVVGDDGTTQEPARTFTYTTQTEYYEDDAFTAPAGNCGPSWNNSKCLMWSASYAGNSRYLASLSNGMGLYQTFSWAAAHNNTHGVNGGGSNTANPLYCDGKESQGYPCNEADDQAWSHIVLTGEQDQVVRFSQQGQGGQQTNTTITSTTAYTYLLTYPLAAQACSDCVAGMYWGNQNDADYLDYYNGQFMGFTQASVSNPDGSLTVHKYDTTLGWGIYDTNQVTCYSLNPCHNDPWWNPTNALHGHEYETDEYDTNGTTLLSKTTTQYSVQCPPSGVGGTGTTSYGNFDGNLVSELDHNNPVAACDIQTSEVDQYTYDGSTASGVPHKTTTYQHDSYGRVTQTTTTSNDGGATGSPTTIITKPVYIWNDAVSTNPARATGTYLIDFGAFTDVEDSSGNRYICTYTSYDGQSYATGQQSGLTAGLVTTTDKYTNCGTASNGFTPTGLSRTTTTYDVFGNPLATTDADANAGNSAHLGCTVGSTSYSTCMAYDTTFDALPVSETNALSQTASVSYTQNAGGGFGLWPTTTTDVNGQTTTATYDGLGRPTSQTFPGEGTGLTTTTTSYTFWCTAGSGQSPCVEVDTTQRLNATTTVTTRAFYDGYGNMVETRAPGPNGQDVVRYRYYDTSGRDVFDSIQYFVTAYTGAPGAAAYFIPDNTQPGTSTTYTNLRSTTVTDALSHASTNTLSVVCTAPGAGDSACYEQALSVDPLGHQSGTLTDALGRLTYGQAYTGNSPATYAVYTTTKNTYDYTGDLIQILHPDGVSKTTFQYDMAGRKTGMTDPDLGTQSYVYDADGNLTQEVDARGSAGTIYAGYDGLDRQIWRNTTNNSPTGAYVTYTYDSTASGNHGVGRLTGETFTNGTLSGSYSFDYDQRGQQASETETVGSASYPVQTTYDDAGAMLTQTYPDGEVVTTSYTAQDWLSGLTTQQGNSVTPLLASAAYSGTGGAGGQMTGASLDGSTYQYAATYDLLLRLTDAKLTRVNTGATLFEVGRVFDAAGNVASQTTTLPQGTDVQQFCYDEQNRLTWAGSVGTPPCTGTAIPTGTLTAAQYSQSFTYDTLGRLTSGPLGIYTYGDTAHLDAVTSIGTSYTASYDAAGNMTCRAQTSASTCSGSSPTGAQLGYDNEGRLTHWQNAPSNPTTTASYLYDGSGNRVAQQVTGSATTTTVYVGALEEATTSGSTTTTTTYYAAGGHLIALAVNGVFSYLGTDGLSSVTVALDSIGNPQASLLFAPYGGARYSSGTMPGSRGFTGQHSDGATGLDYYNARYYDPVAGAFISADTVLPGNGMNLAGLNRYAYVAGNPETATDPTGHRFIGPPGEDGSNPPNPPGTPCPPDCVSVSGGGDVKGTSGEGVKGINSKGSSGGSGVVRSVGPGTLKTKSSGKKPVSKGGELSPCSGRANPCSTRSGYDFIFSASSDPDVIGSSQLTAVGYAGIKALIALLQDMKGSNELATEINNQELLIMGIFATGGAALTGFISFLASTVGSGGDPVAIAIWTAIGGLAGTALGAVGGAIAAQAYSNAVYGEINNAIVALNGLQNRLSPEDTTTVFTLTEDDVTYGPLTLPVLI